MIPRLPPRYYNTPVKARFRKHRLPSELWDTWELLHALAWVNNYEFTPPLSLADMAYFLTIQPDAVRDRLARLAALGWIKVESRPGRANVYTLVVPGDCDPGGLATQGGAPTSMNRICGEDSSRTETTEMHAPTPGDNAPLQGGAPTPGVDSRGTCSTAVGVENYTHDSRENFPKQQQISSAGASEFSGEIEQALEQWLGIGHPTNAELARLAHVTREYVDRLVAFKRNDRDAANRLPGWWVRRIRENWQPPAPRRARWWSDEMEQFVNR